MTDGMHEDDPVAESRQFDKKVNDWEWGGHRNKRMVQVLIALVVAMIILVGAVVVQAVNAANTAKEVKGSELSTYQSCLNRNVQDVDQIGLWRYVIELTGDTKLQTLQHYINSIFAERECIDGPPSSTITYGAHEIVPRTVSANSGATVSVTDKKCIPSEVHVYASIVWTEISPRHVILPELTKSETLSPGCVTHVHRDTVPTDVLAVADAAFKDGAASTTWEISGTETPAPSNMNVVTWHTPEFKIVP